MSAIKTLGTDLEFAFAEELCKTGSTRDANREASSGRNLFRELNREFEEWLLQEPQIVGGEDFAGSEVNYDAEKFPG